MARTFEPTFIPAGETDIVPLDAIPDEVKQEVEEMIAHLADNDGRFAVGYATDAELAQYVKLVKSYLAQRPGPVHVYRKSPVRGVPEGQGHFKISLKSEATTPEVPAVPTGVTLGKKK